MKFSVKVTGVLMMIASAILFCSETPEGSPLSNQALLYLVAAAVAVVGYAFYRLGGGSRIRDMNIFE